MITNSTGGMTENALAEVFRMVTPGRKGSAWTVAKASESTQEALMARTTLSLVTMS